MSEKNKDVCNSLSSSNTDIYKYLDYLLQDLWGLGSVLHKSLELIESNLYLFKEKINTLELCCGKGAQIISLAEKLPLYGLGIDLHPKFIEEAISKSRQNPELNLDFKVMNIVDAVSEFRNYDLVIAGYDLDVLGDEVEYLLQVKRCLSENGFILFESASDSIEMIKEVIHKSGLKLVDMTIYSKEEKEEVNTFNTQKISQRAEELIAKNPLDKDLLQAYVEQQKKESFELENDLCWGVFLLQNV